MRAELALGGRGKRSRLCREYKIGDLRMTITMRPATPTDADAICAIHNQGIADRIATLDSTLRTPADSLVWLTERGPRHPVIVAEAEGRMVGWASLNRFNPRAAYDGVADFSVYVERANRGKGIGGQLLTRLVFLARDLGYHKMVLTALACNLAGIALYTKAGFTRVGVYHEQGQLDGTWVDTLIMEKIL
jgi:phosphinothricin acetyltransferase